MPGAAVIGFAILLSVVGSAFLVLLVLAGRCPQPSRHVRTVQFAVTWLLLVFAGTFCRDILLIIFTVPMLLVSLAMSAVLWRSTGSFRIRAAATVCYWVGVLAVAAAVVHFGTVADYLQCIRENCHGEYNPPPQHPLRDTILWLPAPLLVALGLKLSSQFEKTAIGVAAVALWLIDPVILMMVDWLQPSLGM